MNASPNGDSHRERFISKHRRPVLAHGDSPLIGSTRRTARNLGNVVFSNEDMGLEEVECEGRAGGPARLLCPYAKYRQKTNYAVSYR